MVNFTIEAWQNEGEKVLNGLFAEFCKVTGKEQTKENYESFITGEEYKTMKKNAFVMLNDADEYVVAAISPASHKNNSKLIKDTDLMNRYEYLDISCICKVARKDEDGTVWMKNILDKVPFKGKSVIVRRYSKRIIYKSEVIENATWDQIALRLDQSIEITEDWDHTFLEEVWVSSVKKGVNIIEVFMGS